MAFRPPDPKSMRGRSEQWRILANQADYKFGARDVGRFMTTDLLLICYGCMR